MSWLPSGRRRQSASHRKICRHVTADQFGMALWHGQDCSLLMHSNGNISPRPPVALAETGKPSQATCNAALCCEEVPCVAYPLQLLLVWLQVKSSSFLGGVVNWMKGRRGAPERCNLASAEAHHSHRQHEGAHAHSQVCCFLPSDDLQLACSFQFRRVKMVVHCPVCTCHMRIAAACARMALYLRSPAVHMGNSCTPKPESLYYGSSRSFSK